MRTLEEARILRLIFPSTEMIPPIKPDLKKSPRLQFLDTGLVNHTLGIQHELLGLKDFSAAYKGAIIPHLITQDLISVSTRSDHKPNFWVREKKQSTSEVDLVYAHKNLIIPIEIKSGSTGALKSLHQFVDAASHPYAVRIYGGAFGVVNAVTPGGKAYTLLNLPYYLGTRIGEWVEWFVGSRA